MKNQVIKVLDKEHERKVIEYWKNRGVDTYEGDFCREYNHAYRYYGVIDNEFSYNSIERVFSSNAEIITLPAEEKTFPRKMWVWDIDENNAVQRIVVAYIKNAKYPYICVVDSDYKNFYVDIKFSTIHYKFAKEIEKIEIRNTKCDCCDEKNKSKLNKYVPWTKNIISFDLLNKTFKLKAKPIYHKCTGIDFDCESDAGLWISNQWHSFRDLFENWYWVDESNDERICGTKYNY